MRRRAAIAAVMLAAAATATAAAAERWQVDRLPTPGPVRSIEQPNGEPLVAIGGGWFRVVTGTQRLTLAASAGPVRRPMPPGALSDSRIASGKGPIARAWLAEPTGRYGHGVLGDAIEAGSLVIERRDGSKDSVRLDPGAVFEDLEPRIADLSRDGRERVVTVKSYLTKGSALAVIGERDGRLAVIAETPPIGIPNRWLNPAGIADFDGDGRVDIAFVRMPHAAGVLELWSWQDGRLVKTREMADFSNHAIGSRALRLSQVADFDGDGLPDLAIPSFDRRSLRIVAFAPQPRDIARIALPARVTTEIAALDGGDSRPALLLGLENGSLIAIRRIPNR
jgi:hypothetical protein